MNINLALALLNVILCWWRFVAALRARRLTSIPWFLLAYFSIFFIPVSLEESISWTRGFFAEAVTAGPEEIHRAILFVVLFNMVFSFADKVGELLIARRGPQAIWILPSRTATLNKLSRILGGLWVVGSAWYFWTTRTQNYRDYVEGSSWAIVLFWASSPLITMLAMQKRWLPATVLCVPFIYFALHLQVRSFALLSLVPVIVVGFYQIASDPAARLRFARTIRYGVVGGIALVTLSIWVSKYKTGEVAFPDSGMPFGVVQVVTLADRFDARTGFNSLALYSWNYINPFMRLVGVMPPDLDDVPVVVARLLEGVPEDWPVYFHYPALLWTDAYLSFGWNGLWLAVLWAAIYCVWDAVMRQSPLLLALLLPYFVWHSYMWARGAIAIASVPIAYALYFSFFAFVIVYGVRLFERTKASAALTASNRPGKAPRVPPNLMH